MQKLKAVTAHLQACMQSTAQHFSSWRALCTYLGMIPSVKDAAALEMAEKCITVLSFLKPIWSTEAVFTVPVELLHVCLRTCSICRISWLQKWTMKCIVDITRSVVNHRMDTTDVRGDGMPLPVEGLSLASLARNE